MTGWLGIQRFFDLNDFGVDLVRNGRVIEERSKTFFSWTNPETGESLLPQGHFVGVALDSSQSGEPGLSVEGCRAFAKDFLVGGAGAREVLLQDLGRGDCKAEVQPLGRQ